MVGKFYRCPICGNIVYVVEGNGSHLVCCGKPMEEIVPASVDAAKEKHVPSIKDDDGRLTVQIGEVMHPSLENHYIEWVASEGDDAITIKYLKSGDDPVVHFCNRHRDIKRVLSYCNLHGLWEKEL